VKVATWAERGVQSRDVVDASGVVEDVEQPAVDDGVEGLAERVEVAGVEHLEAGVDAAQGRLAAGELDGAPGDVDTDGASVVERGEDGVLAGAAAGVLRARPARAGTITVALSMLASLQRLILRASNWRIAQNKLRLTSWWWNLAPVRSPSSR
jgi:hypothetical protein